MIFCDSHSKCGQEIAFLTFRSVLGNKTRLMCLFASCQFAHSLTSYACNILIPMHKSPLLCYAVGKTHCMSRMQSAWEETF